MATGDRGVVARCILDLVDGERWAWTDPPDAPRYDLEPFGLVVYREGVST